ncbi:putative guanine deaminase [Trypanosoma conorhini]|uniref:Guanine deaminase n=1 Tax=Trypanosoma conorhini TaxID=83891 RepID=A0A3R7LWL3_9TRYP|nr:putative guanine deaminase [Trypanosoma conorhini]RNF22021.1 putative guanine deaminase [Trypanosoma conorhini]
MPVFCGTAFHVPERKRLEVLQDVLIAVRDADGVIERILRPSDADYDRVMQEAREANKLRPLRRHQYLLPGLIDLHVHAPQWPQTGKALHLPLKDWLQERTFPLEAAYKDAGYAEKVYTSLVETLLANGTTTAMYFATIHLESSVALAKVCLRRGQRAVVGRVSMDIPEACPDFYRDEGAVDSVAKSAAFVESVRALRGNERGVVLPSICPRFLPACSTEALRGLGKLVARYNCHVQTHCSESDWEHNHVIERFKKHDAFVLDEFGLLTRRTVLAHSNFLSEEAMDLLLSRGAAVAHCPLSNFYFANAVFPLKRALDKNLRVGLGTDLAGGHSPSLFDTCRHAVAASCVLEDGVDPNKAAAERSNWKEARINIIEAFWLATAGGGAALDLKVGSFEPGYAFDALVVDVEARSGNVKVFEGHDSLEDVFQKIVYNATPANIAQTWVDGRLVHQLEPV